MRDRYPWFEFGFQSSHDLPYKLLASTIYQNKDQHVMH